MFLIQIHLTTHFCVTYIREQSYLPARKADGIFRYIPTHLRVIISEPVVRQLDFLVIVLSLEKEWYPDVILVGSIEHGPLLDDLPVHVKPAVPHFLALLVVRLHGRAQMVGHDGVCLVVLEQSQGHETLLLKEPCPEVFLVFFYLPILIATLT